MLVRALSTDPLPETTRASRRPASHAGGVAPACDHLTGSRSQRRSPCESHRRHTKRAESAGLPASLTIPQCRSTRSHRVPGAPPPPQIGSGAAPTGVSNSRRRCRPGSRSRRRHPRGKAGPDGHGGAITVGEPAESPTKGFYPSPNADVGTFLSGLAVVGKC